MEQEDEVSEMWRQHDAEMKTMRERRRIQFDKIVESLRLQGYSIRHVSPYQIRINEMLDIYPSNKRWHFLGDNSRGDLRVKLNKVEQFIKHKLATEW